MAIPIPRRKKTEVCADFGKIRIERHELEGEPPDALPWFTLDLMDWVCIAAVTAIGSAIATTPCPICTQSQARPTAP